MRQTEINNEYRVMVWDYPTEDGKSLPITFREWFNPPRIQAKFDNYFAQANGYRDLATMIDETVGAGKLLMMFGGVPDWIDTTRQGEFFFIGRNNNLNLN